MRPHVAGEERNGNRKFSDDLWTVRAHIFYGRPEDAGGRKSDKREVLSYPEKKRTK